MLKKGDGGKEVRELQEKLLSLGYELPQFGADGDFGSETVSAVTEFKRELVDLAEEEGVSTELQRLIDALVIGEWKRPLVKPVLTPEEIEELITEMYDAFHPLFLGTEETEHAESLQTALKRLGFYHGRIDGDFGRGTRRSLQAAQHELELEAEGFVDEQTASAIKELLRKAFSGERWKLPKKDDPDVEVEKDQMALYREIMEENGIPPYFAEALGHKSVETTKQYLGVSYAKMQAASKAIEVDSNRRVLLHSVSEMSTGNLITELIARGFDPSASISEQLQAERSPTDRDDKVISITTQKKRRSHKATASKSYR